MAHDFVTYVGSVAGSSRFAVFAMGYEFVIASLCWHAVDIGSVPRVERDRLAQIRTVPSRFVRGALDQCIEPDLGAGIATSVQAILVKRFSSAPICALAT